MRAARPGRIALRAAKPLGWQECERALGLGSVLLPWRARHSPGGGSAGGLQHWEGTGTPNAVASLPCLAARPRCASSTGAPCSHPAPLLEAVGLERGTLLAPSPGFGHLPPMPGARPLSGAIPALALPQGQGPEPLVNTRSGARLSVCWAHAVRCSCGSLCASLCLCVQFAAARLEAGSVLSVSSPQQSFQGMQPAQDALDCTKWRSSSPREAVPLWLELLGHLLGVASCSPMP